MQVICMKNCFHQYGHQSIIIEKNAIEFKVFQFKSFEFETVRIQLM